MTTPDYTIESPAPVESVTATGLGSTALLGSVVRPLTYEQLIGSLKAGQTCEVPDYMFRDVKGWAVAHSPRFGFVLFLHNAKLSQPEDGAANEL